MSLTLDRSRDHQSQAARVIAGGVNSNVRLAGGAPLCFTRACGAHLTDVDGNGYVDYALGMGPAILGHAPKVVSDAVSRSLDRGTLFAGQSRPELDLARRLQEHLPGAQRVRIGMTGSEMVQAALRVARAVTGRSRVVKFAGHYHGWFDNVLTNEVTFAADPSAPIVSAAPQSGGQALSALTDTTVLPWNDLPTLQAYMDRFAPSTAAILMEPIMCNTGVIPPARGYLTGVRRLCDERGVILIIDEVVTGFRLGLSGAQGHFGVTGDLAVYAKALGGGVPIAALTGRESLMSLIGSGAVNHSGTYNSNLIAVSAALATLDALAADNGAVYAKIAAVGESLMNGIRAAAQSAGESLLVQGYPSVFNTSFTSSTSITTLDEYRRCDEPRQRQFLDALLERGVRPTSRGTWFVSAAHSQTDVEATLAAVRGALQATR